MNVQSVRAADSYLTISELQTFFAKFASTWLLRNSPIWTMNNLPITCYFKRFLLLDVWKILGIYINHYTTL